MGTTRDRRLSGKGYFIQSGGTANLASSSLYLGYAAGSVGTYTLNNNDSPALLNTMNEYVGYSGSGGFTQSGGTHTVAYTLTLGYNAGSSGSYSLSGGSLFAGNGEDIGLSGNGSFTQSGGTNSSPLDLAVGDGGTASYSLSGGLVSTQDLGVGGMKSGVFTQSGGTVIAGGADIFHALGVTQASYNLRSGLLSVTGQEYIGAFGTGSFVQSGGTHSDLQRYSPTRHALSRQQFHGSYNLSAGSLFVPTRFQSVTTAPAASASRAGPIQSRRRSTSATKAAATAFITSAHPPFLARLTSTSATRVRAASRERAGQIPRHPIYISATTPAAPITYGLSGGVLNSSNLFVGYNGAGAVTHAHGDRQRLGAVSRLQPRRGSEDTTSSERDNSLLRSMNTSAIKATEVSCSRRECNSMQVLYLAEFANSGGTYSLGGTGVINNTNGEYVAAWPAMAASRKTEEATTPITWF